MGMSKGIRTAGIITLVTFTLGGAAYLYARRQDEGTGRAPVVPAAGHAAPGFSLKDASGQEHSLGSLRGKVVVLHFWGSWCPPCVEEVPMWLKLARKFEGKPVAFLAVAVDQSWGDAHKIMPDAGLPGNVLSLLDPEGEVPEKFGSFQFPETYVLSKDLVVKDKWVGAQDWDNPAIQARLEEFTK
jgi:thiol-disulfide isomerase/thioredoxin